MKSQTVFVSAIAPYYVARCVPFAYLGSSRLGADGDL